MKYVKLLIIMSLILLGIGCSTEKKQNQKDITFSTGKNMWCGLGIIAHEKGFFTEEGLNVKTDYLAAGKYNLDALVSKSAEFATIVEVNLAYFGYTGNTSVQTIASLVNSTSSGIVALRSSGIEKPEDIKGKRLALSPGTTSDMFANRFLEKYGMSADNVEIRQIQPAAMEGAILSKGVDAASTWDPHIYSISTKLGEDAIVFRDPEAYTGYLNLAVRKDWALENKETVLAFLRALQKADKFAKENVEEAQIIVSRVIDLDLDVVKSTWADHNLGVTFDKQVLLNAMTSEGKWIQATNDDFKDKEVPDYSRFLESSYFMKVNK